MTPTLQIFDNEETLAQAATERFITLAREAVALRSRFRVALAGGSTPERLYSLLATPENIPRVPWPRTFLFLGDERMVPEDSADSNLGMARRTFLSKVPVPERQIHAVPTDAATPEAAADAYNSLLVQELGTPPVFDLVLLGFGSDGHTASLFPGSPALGVTDSWVTSTLPGELPPPVPRVTLTFPAINAARQILVLVTGEKKRKMLGTWLADEGSLTTLPACGLAPKNGNLTVYADMNAAGERRQG